MGALESDTEGLLAQLAHICLLGGRTLAYPLLPAHQTHKPHTKVICIPASLPSPYSDDDNVDSIIDIIKHCDANILSEKCGINIPSTCFEIVQMDPGSSICAHFGANRNKSLRLQMMINGCEGGGIGT